MMKEVLEGTWAYHHQTATRDRRDMMDVQINILKASLDPTRILPFTSHGHFRLRI